MKHSAGRKELRMKMRANRRAAGRKLHKEHVLEQRHPKKPKANEIKDTEQAQSGLLQDYMKEREYGSD